MNRSLMLFTLAAFSAPTLAQAAWTIDQSHGEVGFSVRHMMVSNTKGKFEKFSGTVDIDEKDLTKSVVDVTIDAKSIDTADAKRDEHLRNADFFDVEKFPTLTFKSKKIVKAGKGYKVTGDLTMHGVTKSVVLEVTELTGTVKDPWGAVRRGVSAHTTIDRRDFGLTYNAALEAGGLAVGHDVKISIDVELVQGK